MKKFSSLALIAMIFMIFVITSCDDSEENKKDDEGKTDVEQNDDPDLLDEEEAVDDEETVDDAPVELLYPENVTETSKKKGQIARNLAFFDEKNVEHSLAEWYKPNNESSKLIWIIFSTYDCTYCKIEKKDIPILNGKHAKNGLKTILIMNGYLAGPRPDEEPAGIATLKETMVMMEGAGADHTYGYLGWAHQTEFKKFINSGYPVNVFIDAKTMEIVEHFEGWAKEKELFDEVDGFIGAMLDIL